MHYYQEQKALGSLAQISIIGDLSEEVILNIFKELWTDIFNFEKRFSRFLPGSELSKLNRNAGIKLPVSPQLIDILKTAKKMAAETGGIYNPFILPALQMSGYDHSLVKGYEQDQTELYTHRKVMPAEKLEIGKDWVSIPKDSAIDLGGIGKGYLADKLAQKIRRKVSGYWISLGGDITLGGANDNGTPWVTAIQDALKPESDIAQAETDGASYSIASSGTLARNGVKNGKPWHHLIDPRTLMPAKTDLLLATVVDRSAMRADVFASCAVILGSKDASIFLKHNQVHSALLQGKSNLLIGTHIKMISADL